MCRGRQCWPVARCRGSTEPCERPGFVALRKPSSNPDPQIGYVLEGDPDRWRPRWRATGSAEVVGWDRLVQGSLAAQMTTRGRAMSGQAPEAARIISGQ